MKILKADSGITVLFKRTPSKLVSFRYFVNCGSIDEKRKQDYGLCHALEHMYFAGTESRTWEDISDEFRNVGAWENASTSYDYTEYNCSVPRDGFEKAFEIMADLMYHSTFPEEKWKLEKKAILSEIDNFMDSPEEMLAESIFEQGLGPEYHCILGNKRNIINATPADLVKFSKKYYSGSNMIVSIAGNLTEKQVLKVINKYDKWNSTSPVARKNPKFKFNNRNLRRTRKDLEQSYLYYMKPISWARKIRERTALDILNASLKDYLFKEIRDKQGLCYGIHTTMAEIVPKEDIFLTLETSVNQRDLSKTPQAINKAMENFLKDLSSEHIDRGRAALTRNTMASETQVEVITHTMATWYLAGYRSDPFDSLYDMLKTTSEKLIKKLAEENLSGKFKIGTMGSR